MRRLPDESLLAGFASRDPDVTAAFVRRFQGRVFGLALTILKEPAIAEEIAQETFVRAWEHAGVFDPRRGHVDTWLLTIARNLAIDALRVRGRDMNVLEDTTLLYLSGAEPDTERDGMLAVEVGRLRRAILELPEEQRRVLVLAAFQGRTGREISEREGIPLGTAKTRLRAAMLRLRTELGVTHE
ncbi:MAG: sigma-70 family RNA polymerase sigma factor [Actinomycetota bacterium]|nr:sigma-70 family RNA polymerase sigma factor [Actinomycetota bacterium]